MKGLLVMISVLSLIQFAFAFGGDLDGKTFCRSVKSGGMMGQPAGVRSHCVAFEDGKASDNANTFFGNPPSHYAYSVKGVKIMNTETKKATGLSLIHISEPTRRTPISY